MVQQTLGTSLCNQVSDRIRDWIIQGEYKPGERLTEAEVAERLGVSNIPVREALQQLAQKGLVIREPRRGAYVREFSAQDIRHLFMTRAALDELAVTLLLRESKLTSEGLAEFEALISRQYQAIVSQDYALATDLELRFHGFVYDLLDSELLSALWETLRARLRVLMCWHIQGPTFMKEDVALTSHKKIVSALRRGDAAGLSSHLRQRYEKTAEGLIRALKL